MPTGLVRIRFIDPHDPEEVVALDPERIEGLDPDGRRIVPLTDEAAIGATIDLETVSIEQIAEWTASVQEASPDVALVTSPVYRLDGQEFVVQPGEFYVNTVDQAEATELVDNIRTRVQTQLGRSFLTSWVGQVTPHWSEFSVAGDVHDPAGVIFMKYAADLTSPINTCVEKEWLNEEPKFCEVGRDRMYEDEYADYVYKGSRDEPDSVFAAVLDSFIELDHPDLTIRGVGAYRGISTIRVKPHCATSHGTSCAGIISAEVATDSLLPDYQAVEILAVRVFEDGWQAKGEAALGKGIVAAAEAGASVISVGVATSSAASCLLRDAVDYAIKLGALVVAGSGNFVENRDADTDPWSSKGYEGAMAYPAGYPGVIAVGAAISDGGLARVEEEYPYDENGNPSTTVRWSSRYNEASNAPDSGVDVVAQGVDVETLDLVRGWTPPEGSVWSGFEGTSAAGPIIAGLAVRIRREPGTPSPRATRERIRCLAVQPAGFGPDGDWVLSDGSMKGYSESLGFGWIARKLAAIVCGSHSVRGGRGPVDVEGTTSNGGEVMPGTLPEPRCEVDCLKIPTDYPYANMVKGCLRPMTAFLEALSNRQCCELIMDYMDNPFRTARVAGMPYSAAVWLGSKNWVEVERAVLAEKNMVEDDVADLVADLGPIWVKAL